MNQKHLYWLIPVVLIIGIVMGIGYMRVYEYGTVDRSYGLLMENCVEDLDEGGHNFDFCFKTAGLIDYLVYEEDYSTNKTLFSE